MSTAEQAVEPRARRNVAALPAFGLWSPILTPVKADLSIDTERFVALAKWQLDSGCHGIAPLGTTSEANSFTVEERKALIEAAIEAGIPPQRMMVGTGCCAFPDTVHLTRHALDLGCTRVLMLPPFYYKGMSDAGLARAFSTVIDAIGSDDLRVYLYHFPKMSGVPVTTGLLDLLVKRYPRVIAGVKDSSGDRDGILGLIDRYPDLAIFPGSEVFMLEGLERGGVGCISATANVNPGGIREIFDAWNDDAEAATAAQGAATTVRRAIEAFPTVPALKFLTAHYRRDPAWREVRPPMIALSDENGGRLLNAAASAGLRYEAGKGR